MKTALLIVTTFSLSLFVALVAAELFVRQFVNVPQMLALEVSSDEGSYELIDNPILIYQPKANSGYYNQYGYKGIAHPPQKPQEKNRLLLIGDSVIGGVWISPNKDLSQIISKGLGNDFEVLNFAVPGYGFAQSVEHLKVKGIKWQPDYVLFGLCLNDLRVISGELKRFSQKMHKENLSESIYSFFYSSRTNFKSWFLNSAFFRLLIGTFDENFYLSQKTEMKKLEINSLVSEVFEMANTHHFIALFYVLPASVKDPKMSLDPLLDALNSHNVYNLHDKVHNEYQESELTEYFFEKDPWHYNEKGHSFFGEKILKALKQDLNAN